MSLSVLDLSKKWYHVPLPLRQCSLKDIATFNISKEQMDEYYLEAQTILEKETAQCQADRGRWYNAQFITRGTTADKVASAAVKLADMDFMFFLDGFGLLFDTARTDAHHYEAAIKALAAVLPKLLPPRPLKRFVTQYFATLPTEDDARRRVLVYWYLEDYLKRTYTQFLSLSEAMLKDRLVQRREAWLNISGKLMCAVAEGRNIAMAMMIDKLGDPNAQVAHKAYHHLLALLSESSTHQTMLFTELEKIIFMKNCPLRTMRYAANVMNQLVYSKDERKLALKAVQTYLSLFRQLVHIGGIDSTVTTAIIVGLRRAFPYAGTDMAPLEEHTNALFVLAHTGTFQQRVATLSLLQLLALGKSATEAFQNRWYRALYQLLLLSPKQIPQSSQLTTFFSMLHKAMRSDTNRERISAFVHRLLQRAVYFNDAMICAVLLLVGEMAQAHPHIRQLMRSPVPSTARASGRYDAKHRDPQYSRASSECLWVLHLLSRHSHPSVVKLAVFLLFGEEIVFDSHPLDGMTLLNFLQMFVDAKAQSKEEDKSSTGMAVFRRATHTAAIPSASDPYFIHSHTCDVDVSALFLHRYAVQRQRFIDCLSQVRSTWGDASGEADVALRVSNIDNALFGPSGSLTDSAAVTPLNGVSSKTAMKGKKSKVIPRQPEVEEESVGEGNEALLEDDHCLTAGYLDTVGGGDELEWGNDSDASLDELDDEEDNEDAMGDDDSHALGTHRGDPEDAADEFAELIESHKRGLSKKRKREEEWLERRTDSGTSYARPGRGGMRGRGTGRGSGRRY